MGSESEPAKLLLPFLQRADELQKHEPLVSYYCRLFAMEKGLQIPQKNRTKTTNSILISLMNQLEKDKKPIKLAPDDNLYVEGFASNVFAKADKQDRAGRADINTAKTFYAARIFFEILNQFGELQPDIQQKLKYAEWKAADISKAIKEGRKPEAGPLDLGRSESLPTNHLETGADTSPQFHENNINYQPSTSTSTSQPSHPSLDYPSDDFQEKSSPTNSPGDPSYPPNTFYQHHYPHEPQQPPLPQNYSSHETSQNYPSNGTPQNYPSQETPLPPSSFPHFQSYPNFTDHSLPSAPTHQPSYQQGLDSLYSHQSPPIVQNYPIVPQNSSGSRYGAQAETTTSTAKKFEYDINYLPPPEKIADAHKAARICSLNLQSWPFCGSGWGVSWEFADVQLQIQKICGEIAGNLKSNENRDSPVVDESDLSLKKLDEFQTQLQELQEEKSDRLHKVFEFVSTVRDLCKLFGMNFFSIITEVHPSLNDSVGMQSKSIGNETISKLSKTVVALQEDKKQRLQ
ncbi:hypothetical protein GIB67_036022 [Kingdonia uniflora]|uniref:Vta1/callose synthase N-terminal domain-containing protein n=1 Tax=Kingdonia uniflora TaxID=39325 RepID=A0A7J7N0V0_9MAGN|nr:hypothetical protein GIB67_036022 [Kingdonia uniflora]